MRIFLESVDNSFFEAPVILFNAQDDCTENLNRSREQVGRRNLNCQQILKWIILFFLPMLFSSNLQAVPLTPPYEPRDDSFYVCYTKCRVNYSLRAPLATYRKLKYSGCVITRKPCDDICIKKINCPAVKLKLFDWFHTYTAALNGFYRCAYS
jgi:hypothetical protein